MKLESATSIFNMGDTSIRVNQVVDVYKVILRHVDQFMKGDKTWERNTAVQEEFYRTLLEEIVRIEDEDGISLFRDFVRLKNYTQPPSSRIGMRGRTLTNGVVKTGLLHSSRKLSHVGENYLSGTLSEADAFERLLDLDPDNLVYLRQFLKLRIYAHNSDHYFYNFRFAMTFLSQYENVPQNNFLKILLSIKPGQTEEELLQIITDYEAVANNEETFEQFYQMTFSKQLRSEEELAAVQEMFENEEFTDENFIKYFSNRDSNETSLLYKEFVIQLMNMVDDHCEQAFEQVKRLSRDGKIKKAFSGNRLPFTFTRNETLQQFLVANEGNPLLTGNHYHIYLTFIFSKHNDLIREYSDMCRRTFQITGLFSFERGLVNLNDRWIIGPLLDLLGETFVLTGEESYASYEIDEESVWFQDV